MQKDAVVSHTSTLQIRRLQRHFVFFLLAITVFVGAMIWIYQAQSKATQQTRIFATVEANSQQKKQAFEQLIEIATTHLQRINIQFTDALKSPEMGINETNWKKLSELGIRNSGAGELVGSHLNAWWRERLGALYLSPESVPDALLNQELAAAMAVFPAIHAAHKTYPFFQWTSFYSVREDFLAVYPYVSEAALQQSTNSPSKDSILKAIFNAQSKQNMQSLAPKNNPQGFHQWTAPYFDSGGQGAMVSILLPQYAEKNFIGVHGTDVTLKMFDKVLKDQHRQLGHIIVVDRDDNLIADDQGLVQSSQAILQTNSVLPAALKSVISQRHQMKTKGIQAVENWYWFSLALQGSQWDLITYFSEQELNALAAQDDGNTIWVMLALLAILSFATWLISYYFALPSLKLVDFLVKLSNNSTQTTPAVPKAWRASFSRVAETYHERDVYLHELKLQTENLEETVDLRTSEVVAQRELAEKARKDIELLSEMGREITASLEISSIENNLYQHVQKMISADRFCLGMIDSNRSTITFNFVREHGQSMPAYELNLSAVDQAAVACVLSATEVCRVEIEALESNQDMPLYDHKSSVTSYQSSSITTASALYVPLILKDKVIGVVSVHDVKSANYRQRELVILRSLGAYAAVAFDNAFTYQRLQLAQEKLVEQEKLAALGSIVAGVAHELNTPIGNSLLAATSLAAITDQTMSDLAHGNIRRSSLDAYGSNAKIACDLMVRNLSTAANLITSFKQIAVDQTSDQRRRFNLLRVSQEVALTLDTRLRRENVKLHILIDESIELDSFPGPYGQVLSNLMMNALIHGFADRQSGEMTLSAQKAEHGKEITLQFSDNGNGIEAQHLPHVFEPFYTTRMGQGGSGLGLHICYNIVTAVLGGQVRVDSEAGKGTWFTIVLPVIAP